MKILTKNRREWIAPAVLVAIAVVWVVQNRFVEATYHGKPSSYWAERFIELETQQKPARTEMTAADGARLYDDPNRLANPAISTKTLKDQEMTPVMADLIRHPNPDVRFRAACSFFYICPEDEFGRLVPIIIDTLQNPDEPARRYCAVLLLTQLPNAKLAAPARPVLVAAKNDPNPQVRQLVRDALRRIDPEMAEREGIPFRGAIPEADLASTH